MTPSVRYPGQRARRGFLGRYGKHYLGLAPFLTLFALFILWPMVYGCIMSFTDWSTKMGSVPAFVGLENFRAVLTDATQQGKRFITSLQNLFWFVIIVVP